METLSYLTTIEDKKKILKIAIKLHSANRNIYTALEKRLDMLPKVKLTLEQEVEYPSLCKQLNNLIDL
jgi:flagellar basal body-associated protein FliL